MLYLLPGMGASKEMYRDAWLKASKITYLDWPQYQGETSLSEIAKRFIQINGITSEDSVGGSSLGGMVAVEIHKNLKNKKVVLIGSALNAAEVSPLLRMLAPLASVTPVKWIQSLTKSVDNPFMTMFRAAHPEFIRAMCAAASKWDGYQGARSGILRIHGERDAIIKCPKDAEIIKGAGHLIAMTHSSECVRIIEGKLLP